MKNGCFVQDAVSDCNQALQLQPEYVKALMRRSSAYEKLDDLEGAIADAQKVPRLTSRYRLLYNIPPISF